MSSTSATSSRKRRPAMTSLLDNDSLARLGRMRLQPQRRRTNRSRGEHLSGKGGSSTEFSDYRDYVPGDDTRFVDWNIFSRLHRPYIKLFRLEEEMQVVILIDGSSSMLFEEKLLKARQLAAAFGVMGMMAMEPVSLYVVSDATRPPAVMPPATGRISMRRLFAFLESDYADGGDCPLEIAIDRVLARHRGRGIAVLLSDFLTFGDLSRGLNMLHSAGLETFAVQILGPSEVEPDVDGDVRFIDSETGANLDVTSAPDLLGIYREQRLGWEAQLAAACRQRSGRFLSVSSDTPLRSILFEQMLRRGWMR